ncbi:MAG: MGMT family protein [Gordonia sp. (in: high G+C Gram-positive bacteria)]|uniref:MGMT family protein n=1 Tax=Gordonia TaxID=2053 RepID=UPI003265806A
MPDSRPSIVLEVRDAVAAIEPGTVVSYGDLGRRLGIGPRQVGRAMGLLDAGVPWWRVVRADGTPASCHGGQAPVLLAREGVPMKGRRVDMRRAHRPAE